MIIIIMSSDVSPTDELQNLDSTLNINSMEGGRNVEMEVSENGPENFAGTSSSSNQQEQHTAGDIYAQQADMSQMCCDWRKSDIGCSRRDGLIWTEGNTKDTTSGDSAEEPPAIPSFPHLL